MIRFLSRKLSKLPLYSWCSYSSFKKDFERDVNVSTILDKLPSVLPLGPREKEDKPDLSVGIRIIETTFARLKVNLNVSLKLFDKAYPNKGLNPKLPIQSTKAIFSMVEDKKDSDTHVLLKAKSLCSNGKENQACELLRERLHGEIHKKDAIPEMKHTHKKVFQSKQELKEKPESKQTLTLKELTNENPYGFLQALIGKEKANNLLMNESKCLSELYECSNEILNSHLELLNERERINSIYIQRRGNNPLVNLPFYFQKLGDRLAGQYADHIEREIKFNLEKEKERKKSRETKPTVKKPVKRYRAYFEQYERKRKYLNIK